MSKNMNSDDKTFLSKLMEGLEKKIDKVDNHLEKTCDELGELDKKMVRFDERLENHLQSTEKNKKSKKDWIAIITGITAVISATGFSILHHGVI